MESGQQPAIVIEPSLDNVVIGHPTPTWGHRTADDQSSVLHSVDVLLCLNHDHSLAGLRGEKLFGDGSRRFA